MSSSQPKYPINQVINAMFQTAQSLLFGDQDPPKLISYCSEIQELKMIASNLENFFHISRSVILNEKSLSEMDFIIRTFFLKASEQIINKHSNNVHETISLRHDTQMNLSDLSSSNDTISYPNSKKDIVNQDELMLEIKKLKEDKIESQKKTDQLIKEHEKSKKSFEKIQSKNKELKAALHNLLSSEKNFKNSKNQLEQQIENKNDEVQNLKREIKELNMKISAKNAEINSMNETQVDGNMKMQKIIADNQRLALGINEYKRKFELAKTQIEKIQPDQINAIYKEKLKLQTSISYITNQLESTSKELIESQNNFQILISLIHKMMKASAIADDQMNNQIALIDHLTKENASLKSSKEEILIENESLQKYQAYFNKLKKKLSKFPIDFPNKVSGDYESIILYLEEAVKTNQNMQENNEKKQKEMFIIIENILKFIMNLVTSNKIDILLLSNDESSPHSDQDYSFTNFKEEILREATKMRQFAISNGVELNQSIDLNKICKDREIFDIISAQIVETRTIQKYYDNLISQHSQYLSTLQEICQIFNYNDNVLNLPHQLNNLKTNLESLFRKDFDKNSAIYEIIQKNTELLKQFDSNLRKSLDYTGSLFDLPNFASDFIKNSTSKFNEKYKDLKQQYDNKIEQIQKDFKNENEKNKAYMKFIEDDRSNIERMLNKTNDEKIQIENELNKMKKEYKKQNERLEKKNNDLTNEISTLKQEKKVMQKSIEGNMKKIAEEQINSAIYRANEQNQKEINNLKTIYKAKDEKLRNKYKTLKQKYLSIKENFLSVKESYNDTIQKQNSTIALLKTKNDELSGMIDSSNKKSSQDSENSEYENMRLNALIKATVTEKNNLQSKIQQFNEKISQIQQTRDNYWETKLSMKETEMRARESSREQEKNLFIKEIIKKLSYLSLKPIDFSFEYIVKCVEYLIHKIKEDEITISQLQNECIKASPSINISQEQINFIIEENKEWERWGKVTYENLTGTVPNGNSKKLQMILGELLVSSIHQKSIYKKLENVRDQKEILLQILKSPLLSKKYHEVQQNKQKSSIRSLIIVSLFTKLFSQKFAKLSLIPFQ